MFYDITGLALSSSHLVCETLNWVTFSIIPLSQLEFYDQFYWRCCCFCWCSAKKICVTSYGMFFWDEKAYFDNNSSGLFVLFFSSNKNILEKSRMESIKERIKSKYWVGIENFIDGVTRKAACGAQLRSIGYPSLATRLNVDWTDFEPSRLSDPSHVYPIRLKIHCLCFEFHKPFLIWKIASSTNSLKHISWGTTEETSQTSRKEEKRKTRTFSSFIDAFGIISWHNIYCSISKD